MEYETLELLLNEVNSGIEALGNVEKGSNEYGSITDDTCKLLDKATILIKEHNNMTLKREEAYNKEKVRIEDLERAEKIRLEELENNERVRKEDNETRKSERIEDRCIKAAEAEDQKVLSKKNRIVEYVKIAVPVVTAAALVLHDDRLSKMLLKFEETGTLTTSYSRSFFGKILRRGK